MRIPRSLFLALLALPSMVSAQALAPAPKDPRGAELVTTAWLAKHLKDANLVLLHVGDAKEYPVEHIPGARAVAMQDISVTDRTGKGLVLEMPNADSLRAKLASLGVTDNSRIVIYYGNDWASPTTRIFLTLHWAGLGDRTSILDGGMGAWKKEGHAVTAEVPAPKQGTLSPLKVNNFVVNFDFVKSMMGKPGVSIIDGRAATFYDGVETGGGPTGRHKTGHIAGAKSVPYTSITDETMHFRSAKELEAIFTNAGVGPKDVIIGYCHIGQQTTLMLTAARSLGHPILFYDGSFQDWSAKDGPVETTPAAKP